MAEVYTRRLITRRLFAKKATLRLPARTRSDNALAWSSDTGFLPQCYKKANNHYLIALWLMRQAPLYA
jgi:hypothetical protein